MWSSPTVENGDVYIGCDDGQLYALSANDGSRKWSFDAGGPVRATPAVDDQRVYIGIDDTPYQEPNFFAIDKQSGELDWEFSAEGAIPASTVIDGEYVYIPDRDGILYKLDKESGVTRWEYEAPRAINSEIAITSDLISFISNDSVFAVDNEGDRSWELQIGYNNTSGVSASQDQVYVGTEENVTVIDASDGIARQRISTEQPVTAIPAVANGQIYVGDEAGNFFSIGELKRFASNSTQSRNGTEEYTQSSPSPDTRAQEGITESSEADQSDIVNINNDIVSININRNQGLVSNIIKILAAVVTIVSELFVLFKQKQKEE